MVVSTLMWHWVSRAGRGPGTDAGRGACGTRVRDWRGPGTDAGRGACGTRVRGWRGPRRRDSRGGETAAEARQPRRRDTGGICPENLAAHRQGGTRRSYGLSSDAPVWGVLSHDRSPTLRKRPIYPDLSDITWASGHDRRYHQAQRVKTHSAQAERLGVKVLEAEGCSGSCHGILPGLEPGPFAKLV